MTEPYSLPLIPQLLPVVVEKLGGKRAAPYAGAIGLKNTIYLSDHFRGNTQSCAGACTNGIGGSDKRIGSEINVEHRSLGSFCQYISTTGKMFVDEMFALNYWKVF